MILNIPMIQQIVAQPFSLNKIQTKSIYIKEWMINFVISSVYRAKKQANKKEDFFFLGDQVID